MTKKLQKRRQSGTSKTGVGAGAGCFACGDFILMDDICLIALLIPAGLLVRNVVYF